MIHPIELAMSFSFRELALGVLTFLITIFISLAIVSFILVKLPSTYFQDSHARDFWVDRHPSIRWAGLTMTLKSCADV